MTSSNNSDDLIIQSFVEMGFQRSVVLEALSQSDNEASPAMEWLELQAAGDELHESNVTNFGGEEGNDDEDNYEDNVDENKEVTIDDLQDNNQTTSFEVDQDLVHALVDMGYDKTLAYQALIDSSNDPLAAMAELDLMETSKADDISNTTTTTTTTPLDNEVDVFDLANADLLVQLLIAGHESEEAAFALAACNNDLIKAMEYLNNPHHPATPRSLTFNRTDHYQDHYQDHYCQNDE
jgi:uncharacterized UBP type Zn finger protein